MPLVVLTGAEGTIGSGFRDEYHSRYRDAYDLRLAAFPEDFSDDRFRDVVRFDLEDLGSVRAALRGADCAIHLAGNADWQAPFDEVHGPNVLGAYHVFEAARLEGVRRVVYASSIHAVMAHPPDHQVHERDPVRPDGAYGATKVWGEALCSVYAHVHGMSCIALRIGGYVGADRIDDLRGSANPLQLEIVITQRDLAQLLHRSVTAPEHVRYAVVHALSDNRWKRLDLTFARDVLGYRPEDDAFAISREVRLGPEEPL